jgi:carboxypeptidase PM20D1
MLKALKIIGLILIVLVGILLGNTLTLNSKQVVSKPIETVALPDDIFENLSEAIKFPTISYSEESIPDSTAFFGFHRFLSETFPLVHSKLVLEKINEYSLLYTWEGSDSSKKPHYSNVSSRCCSC